MITCEPHSGATRSGDSPSRRPERSSAPVAAKTFHAVRTSAGVRRARTGSGDAQEARGHCGAARARRGAPFRMRRPTSRSSTPSAVACATRSFLLAAAQSTLRSPGDGASDAHIASGSRKLRRDISIAALQLYG